MTSITSWCAGLSRMARGPPSPSSGPGWPQLHTTRTTKKINPSPTESSSSSINAAPKAPELPAPEISSHPRCPVFCTRLPGAQCPALPHRRQLKPPPHPEPQPLIHPDRPRIPRERMQKRRLPAPIISSITHDISSRAYPRPRASGCVHTPLTSMNPGTCIRFPAIASSRPPRKSRRTSPAPSSASETAPAPSAPPAPPLQEHPLPSARAASHPPAPQSPPAPAAPPPSAPAPRPHHGPPGRNPRRLAKKQPNHAARLHQFAPAPPTRLRLRRHPAQRPYLLTDTAAPPSPPNASAA